MSLFDIFTYDGRYKGTTTCSKSIIEGQLSSGDTAFPVLQEDITSLKYLDLAGVPTLMPVRPSLHSIFDHTIKQWVDPRTLQEFKTSKWVEIRTAREDAIARPLITPFGVFDADEKASVKISQAVLLANTLFAMNQPVAIDFTLADNTVVRLDAAKMVQVWLLLASREQAIRATATLLRTQINNATTQAVVEDIIWPIKP